MIYILRNFRKDSISQISLLTKKCFVLSLNDESVLISRLLSQT